MSSGRAYLDSIASKFTLQEIEEQVERENEEDDMSISEHADLFIEECLNDFPEVDSSDQAARHAAEITRAAITDSTRSGHKRIIKAYIAFHLRRTKGWDPRLVTLKTPDDITCFITQKCGAKELGFEGKKYPTAVSTRAALSYWYRSIRPYESTTEWRYDPDNGRCFGLPTRSRAVSSFMTGLEREKARAGEVSHSARALTLKDMLSLHNSIFDQSRSSAAHRQAIVRWAVYLFAWLALLRIDEALHLDFESIDMPPNERKCFRLLLKPRKSAQTGVTRSWILWANDAEPRICPVRALIQLACLYNGNIPFSGSLFVKVNNAGAVLKDTVQTPEIISRALAIDLQDLGYKSWELYGTHSFRRGGCQYRLRNKGWSPDMVACWGGWSQIEAVTMFRYFYSPNDNHEFLSEYDRNDAQSSCWSCSRVFHRF